MLWINYKFKHISCIFSWIFPRKRWSCLDTISEIVFVKCRLRYQRYQKILHGKLLLLVIEIEEKKTAFQKDNALIHTAAITKTWFQNCGIELLPNQNRVLLWTFLARKIYNQEKTPIENIAELWKKNKIKEYKKTLNKLGNSVPNRLIKVIGDEEKSTKYRMKT